MTTNSKIQTLRTYIAKEGLKNSRQRETIAEVFFACTEHVRVEELLSRVREVDPKASQATVYRTMKLLADCKLASTRQFQDGHTRYEVSDDAGLHHDHLICTQCGKIVEFLDERIEAIQDEVAKSHGFAVTDHKMELYGACSDCQ